MLNKNRYPAVLFLALFMIFSSALFAKESVKSKDNEKEKKRAEIKEKSSAKEKESSGAGEKEKQGDKEEKAKTSKEEKPQDAGDVKQDDEQEKQSSEKSGGMSDGTKLVLSKIVFYIPNLCLDLVDVVKLNVGIGPGLGVHVQATEPLQAGFIFYDDVRIGLNGRFDYYRREDSFEFGIGYAYLQEGEIKRNNSEIGGIVQLIFLGVEAAVNLEEVGDFIGCIFFCDGKEDDLYFE